MRIEDICDNNNLQKVVETVMTGECLYFDETSNITIKWISVEITDEPVVLILHAFKKIESKSRISNW